MTAAAGTGDPQTWNMQTSLPLMSSFVAGEELAAMADARDDIIVLTADLMTSNRMSDFAARHPGRFVDMGIAEQNMTSVAAGLAACGYTPYIATFASFIALLCAEQIRTDLAYPQLPVRILAHHAGISLGFYGTSHHATEDIAIMRSIEQMTVVSAADAAATRAVLRSTADHPGPVYVRLGRGREKTVYQRPPALTRGRFVTVRDGRDVTVIATGITVAAAVEAAQVLAGAGVDVRVLDAVYLKPFDTDAVLDAARQTQGILTVEEHTVLGGLGGAVAEVLAEAGIRTRFRRHGLGEDYALIAPPTHLWRHYGLSAEGIVRQLCGLLG